MANGSLDGLQGIVGPWLLRGTGDHGYALGGRRSGTAQYPIPDATGDHGYALGGRRSGTAQYPIPDADDLFNAWVNFLNF